MNNTQSIGVRPIRGSGLYSAGIWRTETQGVRPLNNWRPDMTLQIGNAAAFLLTATAVTTAQRLPHAHYRAQQEALANGTMTAEKPKLCKDCKWRKFFWSGPIVFSWGCSRPIGVDLVNGGVKRHEMFCDLERDGTLPGCGPDGVFWEPRK